MQHFTALVLAGDRSGDDPQAGAIPGRKALLHVSGAAMLEHVLSALKGARQVGDVFVVANRVQEIKTGLKSNDTAHKKVRFLEGGGSPASSILMALEKLKLPMPVLIVTADSPLLQAGEIDDFCEKSIGLIGVDATVGMIEKSKFSVRYPDIKRTFISLKGEGFKACNIFALLTPGAKSGVQFWLKMEKDRKKVLAMVAGFGLGAMLAYVFGTLTLDRAFGRASKVIGAEFQPVIMANPDLAMDVDTLAHAVVVEEIFSKRVQS